MADNICVDKKQVTTIRPELMLPLFDLIAHMNSIGWNFSLKMPNDHNGYISFQKVGNWHDRVIAANDCKFGYPFASIDRETIEACARRSAELCLTVYESMPNLLPKTPNIYGEITPCAIANKPEYNSLTYAEFQKQVEERCSLKLIDVAPWVKDAFYLTFYRHTITILNSERATLLADLTFLEDKLSGLVAVDG